MRIFFIILLIIAASAVSAEYLTITDDYNDNNPLYHSIGNMHISITEDYDAAALTSTIYDENACYYMMIVNNSNYSIPESSVIYRDYENNSIIFLDKGNINIGKGNEITRLFFNHIVEYSDYDVKQYTKPYKTEYSFLDSIADYIDADSIYNTVAVLSGEWSYPSGYYNYSRFTGQPGNDTAANYLFTKFQTYGLDSVFYHEFSDEFPTFMGGGALTSKNVIALKKGNGNSDGIIVVGAHFDDVSEPYNDKASNSPGADDNASGIAGVLEIARIFNTIESDRDIYFVCFSGEEEGLYGSYYFVYDFIDSNNLDVFAMINMDMIAYTTGLYKLTLYGQPMSSPLKNLYSDIASNITSLDIVMGGSSSGSDHYYFEQAGYKAVFGIETEFSPVYHTYADSISYMTNDFMREVIRASAGTCYEVMNMPSIVEDIALIDNGDSSVTVQWSKIGDTDINKYRVHYNGIYSDAGDTSRMTISSLKPDTLYTFYVTAFDNDDLEGFYNETDTITPSFIPHSTEIMDISSDSLNVYLSIKPVKISDFNYFNIYRSQNDENNFILIDQTSDTSFSDTSIHDNSIYYYCVSVVDNDSNESPLSSSKNIRIITLNEFILVLDETNNSAAIPDSKTDAFYDSVFALYTHRTIDCDNLDNIGITQIGDYKITVYIDDDLNNSKMNIGHFADYIHNGGKLIIFGWDIGSVLLSSPDSFPAFSNSGKTAYDDFGIFMYNREQSFDMSYLLYNDGVITDSIYFEADKLPRGSGGKLNYGGIFMLKAGFSELGKYISASADTSFNGKTALFMNEDTSLILADIPLYPVNLADAQHLVSYLMEKMGCYAGMENNVKSKSMSISKINSQYISILLSGFNSNYMEIDMYDINGRKTANLFKGIINSESWILDNELEIPSGIYFIHAHSDRFSQTEKMIMMQ